MVESIRRESEAALERDARPGIPDLPPADHVQHREHLARLNRDWTLDARPADPPRRWSGRLGRRFHGFVGRLIFGILERYLLSERAFLESLVRVENDLAKKTDRLEDEIRELLAALRTESERLRDRDGHLHRLLEERIARLERVSSE